MKAKVRYVILVAIIAVVVALLPVKVNYKIYSIGRIFPEREWILGRNSDDRISSIIKNNLMGTVSSYGGKEFQKGEVFDFSLNNEIINKKYLKEGETIGFLQSKELKRMLEELEDQLNVEKSLLTVYSSGQKSEIVSEAKKALNLAEEQFNIKKKIYERKKRLYGDSLIATQDYDLALNEYETSRINYELAKAKIETVSTGEKPEQINFSNQKIVSLSHQIKAMKKRMESLQINTPFSGMMLQKKSPPSIYQSNAPYVDILANLADTSNYIIIAPVQLKEVRYLSAGQKVQLRLLNSSSKFEGEIFNVDNVIQLINGKQAVFVTAKIKKGTMEIFPGIIAQATIETGELTIFEYAKRVLTGIFY